MATDRKLGIIEVTKLQTGYYITASGATKGLWEGNTHLQTVTCPFPALKYGKQFFKDCTNLTSVTISNLGNLEDAQQFMQGCSSVTSVTLGSLSSLKYGQQFLKDCTSLSTVSLSDLVNLENADELLCNTGISSINLIADKCTSATDMLKGTKVEMADISMAKLTTYGSGTLFGMPNTVTKLKGNFPILTSCTLPVSIRQLTGNFSGLSDDKAGNLISSLTNLQIAGENAGNPLTFNVTSFNGKSFNNSLTSAYLWTANLDNATALFAGCQSLTNVPVVSATNLTTITRMCENCTGILNVPSHIGMFGSAKYAQRTFSGCTAIPAVQLQIDNVIDCSGMFEMSQMSQDSNPALTYAYLDTSDTAFTTANSMFKGCKNLANVGSTKLTDGNRKPMNMNAVTDAESMFEGCSALTYFYSQTAALINGGRMFANSGVTKVLSGGTGTTAQLPKLINGSYMFYNVEQKAGENATIALVTPNLVDGAYMFANTSICYLSLSNQSLSLPYASLSNGLGMFENTALQGVKPEVSSGEMYTLGIDVTGLVNGESMFNHCTSLTYFKGDLKSLKTGYNMFCKCKIDRESLAYIADNIRDVTTETDWTYDKWSTTPTTNGEGETTYTEKGVIEEGKRKIIHIDCYGFADNAENNGSTPEGQAEGEETDPKTVTHADYIAARNKLEAKGWTLVTCGYNEADVVYDISEANTSASGKPFVHNLDLWIGERYEPYGLQITSITYDGTNGVMNGTTEKDRKSDAQS